jgi:hypothetical protein
MKLLDRIAYQYGWRFCATVYALAIVLALVLASCEHGSCGSPTDPGGTVQCSSSAYCDSLRQPGDPSFRCYSPSEDGSASPVCLRPGPPCVTSAQCHTDFVCVVSIELLSGRGAQPPVRTCQSTRSSCRGNSDFNPGANFR